MSPGGITYMNRVYKLKLHEKVINFVEDMVISKVTRLDRRAKLRKHVDEA